jgi:hypothetical protein
VKKQDNWTHLGAWLDDAKVRLGLSDWVITLVKDASDIDAWADIEAHSQATTASLRVSHDFWRQDPKKQRLILTHELIHIITCRHDQVIESLSDPLGKIAWAVFEPQHDDATERAVEHLATIIAPHLPLPTL